MPEPANLGGSIGYSYPAAAGTAQDTGSNDPAFADLDRRLNALQADALAGINGLKSRIALARRTLNATKPNARSNFLMSDVDEIALRLDMAAMLAARLKELPATLAMPTNPDQTIALLDSRIRRAIDALRMTVVAAWKQRRDAAQAKAQAAAASRAAILHRLGR